jgi:hypothetical protein
VPAREGGASAASDQEVERRIGAKNARTADHPPVLGDQRRLSMPISTLGASTNEGRRAQTAEEMRQASVALMQLVPSRSQRRKVGPR